MILKKASRHGRYRKSLLSPGSLLPIADRLEIVFGELDQKRLQGILGDAEFLGYGLLTLLACRRSDAFQKNQTKGKKTPAPEYPNTHFTLSDFWQLLYANHLPVVGYEKILNQKIPLRPFLNTIRFRGIPVSAHMALLKWLDNVYPLTLVFHIPSVAEVFALQKNGGRCISFFKEAGDLTALHHERDAMSFTVHDLIHAHEFYANPQRAKQQIGFYHWLDNIKNHPQLLKRQMESADFLERWEYVLSDMNSYCGHLLKTLNAAFTIYDHKMDEGPSLWESIIDDSDLETREKELFRKVNSPQWQETDFLQLEAVFEKRFASLENSR